MEMPLRKANLVIISYDDGTVEQYRDVDVQDMTCQHFGEPVDSYKTINLTDKKLVKNG
jgi:hypothetical protein